MLTNNDELGQLYYEIDGELKPLEMGASIEECTEIVSDVDSALCNPEYFKGGITFKMPRKEHKKFKKALQIMMPIYFTNNWRKIHHLPLIRRRGKMK